MTETRPSTQRRHDLDALRAFAMLLGIALHISLSLKGDPWLVQDAHPDKRFGWLYSGIHGFRMSLFILISGYFTMMLWRQRGLSALIKQRSLRVLIPCLLASITLVPAFRYSTYYANRPVVKTEPAPRSEFIEAIKRLDLQELEQRLASGEDPNQSDPERGIPALGWAALIGDVPITRLLIERGANVNQKDLGNYTALHSAAFLGFVEIAEILIDHGADPVALGGRNDKPIDSTNADWATTKGITDFLQVPLREEVDVQEGRAKCRELLTQSSPTEQPTKAPVAKTPTFLDQARGAYVRFQFSPFFSLPSSKRTVFSNDVVNWFPILSPIQGPNGQPFHFIYTSIFDYLWFLWFLCWYVAIFVIVALVSNVIRFPKVPRILILSPLRLLWLIPLTMIPQVFMGIFSPDFGPDTSTGLLPQFHVLAYYGVFFLFGSLYYDADDQAGQLGRYWWLGIPLSLFVLLPVGKAILTQTVNSGLLQVSYAWLMSFGLIGLFRACVKWENKTIRYLSDSAYWLYLAHLPLVIMGQYWVKNWDWSASMKFVFLGTLITGFLLVTYQLFVRSSWIGWLLNGPRKSLRPAPPVLDATSD